MWCDPQRPDLGATANEPASLLADSRRFLASECDVVRAGNKVILRIPPSSTAAVSKALAEVPSGMVVAMMTGLDPAAHGCLVWRPGQPAPYAITASVDVPPGQTDTPDDGDTMDIAGCFAAFGPGIEWSGAVTTEDGFFIGLTDLDWSRVRQSIQTGKAITIESTNPEHMDFTVKRTEEVYHNPVDGLEYHAVWTTHKPVGGVRTDHLPPGTQVTVRLLTSEADLQSRTTTNELADFLQRAERITVPLLTDAGSRGKLTIQLDCTPDQHRVRLASRGDFSPPVLKMLESQLTSLEPLQPSGPVSVQLQITIERGNEE